MTPRRPVALAAFALALSARAAQADDAQDRERLGFITSRMEAAYPKASRWYHGWTNFFVITAAGQGALAATLTDRDLRNRATVGFYVGNLATLSMALLPQASVYGTERLRLLPESSPNEVRVKLAKAERELETAAMHEKLGRSWFAYASAAVVSAGSAYLVYSRYDQPRGALLMLAINVPIGQLKVVTQPTESIRAWDEYNARYRRSP